MTAPTVERDRFALQQLRATNGKLVWIEDGGDARERFQQLAMDTYDALTSLGADFVLPFDPWPESAGNGLMRGWGKRASRALVELPDHLVQRWREWNAEYYILRAESPKLELRDLMQDISESHDASSWPIGYERRIQDWVDAGDASAPPPFDDRYNVAKEDTFRRLQTLRALLKGWMFWDDQINAVRFAPESEWQVFRAGQESAEAKWLQEWEQSRLRMEHLSKRLSEILALARADLKFWSALREWEQMREAKRPQMREPAGVAKSDRSFAGSYAVLQANPEEQAQHSHPIDPLLASFVKRADVHDDAITPRILIINLRAEVRRELGLDNVLGWAGGPGIGEA